MTKNKQKDNPKFSFLFGGEYFNYYQYKVTTEQAILKQKGINQMQNADPRLNVSQQAPVAVNNVGMAQNNGLNPMNMGPSGNPAMVNSGAPHPGPGNHTNAAPGHMPNMHQNSGPGHHPGPGPGPGPGTQNSINRSSGWLQNELANLQTQQTTLQDQVRQSEQNLAAQHAALMAQQQGRVEDAVRQAQESNLQNNAQTTNTDLTGFDTVLQPIIDSCTKDSISAGKAWILLNSTTLESNQVIAEHLLKRVIQETVFNHKLHIIYLVNDVLHHCARKKSLDLRKAMESVVVPMFCNASLAASEDQINKLNKLLSLWESKNNYFEEGIIDKLKNPSASWADYQASVMSQHANAITTITSTTKQTFDNYQAQHQAFVNHALRQIQNIEQQKIVIDRQLKAPPPAPMEQKNVPPPPHSGHQGPPPGPHPDRGSHFGGMQPDDLGPRFGSVHRDDRPQMYEAQHREDRFSNMQFDDRPPRDDRNQPYGPPDDRRPPYGGPHDDRFDDRGSHYMPRSHDMDRPHSYGGPPHDDRGQPYGYSDRPHSFAGPPRCPPSAGPHQGPPPYPPYRGHISSRELNSDMGPHDDPIGHGGMPPDYPPHRGHMPHGPPREHNNEMGPRDDPMGHGGMPPDYPPHRGHMPHGPPRELNNEMGPRDDPMGHGGMPPDYPPHRGHMPHGPSREHNTDMGPHGDPMGHGGPPMSGPPMSGPPMSGPPGHGGPPRGPHGGPMGGDPNFSQPPPGWNMPPGGGVSGGIGGPPGGPESFTHLPLPDLSKPPPGFGMPSGPPPLMSQEICLDDLMPSMPYFELPAGLMVPLIKLEDCEYKSLNADAIRLPPPAPPSDRLIAAVEAFYALPNHDSPRDSDGWEKLGLYEYYRAKNAARKRKEDDIHCGLRPKSRSPSPIIRPRSKSLSPPKKRYRSKSRSRSRSKSRERPKSRSRTPPPTPNHRRNNRSNHNNRNRRRRNSGKGDQMQQQQQHQPPPTPDRRLERSERSPTPPSFLGSMYSKANQEMSLDESNKGHQLLRKMGWGGAGLGANEQGIEAPISGGEVRDRTDQYKGVGINLNDPYENFRKSKGQAFITRMKARAEERAEERGDRIKDPDSKPV
ncbi:calcium homeostasis endoplasmic reticulum protein isoform X2 [Copidosoma floridanum]|nr:calcium homeostasis endoplasmic reticulum protein isoform X2 [Copidosoma floridanum]